MTKTVFAIGVGLLLCLTGIPPAQAALTFNEVVSCNTLLIDDEDKEFEDLIEIYNSGPDTLDLLGYGLTDDPADLFKWVFPPRIIYPGQHRIIYASGKDRFGYHMHSNFKLDSDGEPLILTDPNLVRMDSVFTDSLPADMSKGRQPDGDGPWYFFATPTPELANTETGYNDFAELPLFSQPGGFYPAPFSVQITSPTPGALITYTTDASDPQPDSAPYLGPIPIDATTILRARCFADSLVPSSVATATYFLGESSALPIISLVTDPANLWDEQRGIYVLGDDYQPEYPHWGANFWQPWERPAHLELFETDGQTALSQGIGIRIHGGYTRALPQKSLRLIARKGYGDRDMDYQVFADKSIDAFKYLILRNSGNDWCYTQFRDALMQGFLVGEDLDLMSYRPAALFINGEYWGVQNIRERLDPYYLRDNHGADVEQVDLIKEYEYIMAGDDLHYQAMIAYIEANGLLADEHFQYIQTQMDTDNFATYCILEIFVANTDWPGGNMKWWRPRTPEGRWRWMVYDTDFGLGLYEQYSWPSHNTLAFALNDDGPEWPNPPRSTFLLRSLMANATFRRDFINRYAELMSSKLEADRLVAQLQDKAAALAPEMQRHMERWGYTLEHWQQEVDRAQLFLNQRQTFARTHVKQVFNLPDTLLLSLAVSPPEAGGIALTALTVDSSWSGVYFQGNPIPLRAMATEGWHFVGWSDLGLPQEPDILLSPSGATQLTAHFQQEGYDAPRALINEINYNSALDFDPGDWVELHNPGSGPFDISGWQFRDGDDAHIFTLPPGSILESGAYLVLCENLAGFQALFPEVTSAIGDLGFGFAGSGELLRLLNGDALLFDWVAYDDTPPWPLEPDGGGPTLELVHPYLDNTLATSWFASTAPALHGTPGEENSVFDPISAETPVAAAHGLERPHPNPFNSTTQLAFTLASGAHARLSIHDLRGRSLAVLVDAALPAGRHSRSWRADGLASGIYLLRLQVAGEVFSHRLVHLK